jgi:hypothetical protein
VPLALFAVAAQFFYSTWEDQLLAAWAAHTFTSPTNMSLEVCQLTAATTQVKLCPYDEEELAIWFCLIEAQLAVAGIKSQKLKYANPVANLSKQVLWDILDTVNACNELDKLFYDLKAVLLGKLGKSKCQSYFELLCLPLDMQGLKPSILMVKLKQSLPHGVSPYNDLFLAMFLI